jgi:hypothetical protein
MPKRNPTNIPDVELNSVHYVKILLCYLLDRLNRPVTENQLCEIAIESETINYFYYAEALSELISTGAVSKKYIDDKEQLVLEPKGRMSSDYFNQYIPIYFRKRLLTSALWYFAELRRESEAVSEISETKNGYEVSCTIKDASYDLMRITLYAPDIDQAKIIKDKIMLNPAEFYKNVIEYAVSNQEEAIDADGKL